MALEREAIALRVSTWGVSDVANLLQLEEAIIDRLETNLKQYTDTLNAAHPPEQAISVDVRELPVNPEEINGVVTGTQVWVAFRKETFEPPPRCGVSNPLKPPSQNREITFELIVRAQALRVKGHQRIYPILDIIRDALTGFMPTNIHTNNGITKPFFPVQAGFTNMGQSLWVYSMTFTCYAVYNAPIKEV
jgi:Gp37 protein